MGQILLCQYFFDAFCSAHTLVVSNSDALPTQTISQPDRVFKSKVAKAIGEWHIADSLAYLQRKCSDQHTIQAKVSGEHTLAPCIATKCGVKNLVNIAGSPLLLSLATQQGSIASCVIAVRFS
jgi:hypothetical protein